MGNPQRNRLVLFMVKHVVTQKFIDKNDAIEARKMLLALMGVVPTLRSIEVGINELESERAHDLVIIATFDDMEGLHSYDAHEAHEAVRAFIKPRRSASVSVDFYY